MKMRIDFNKKSIKLEEECAMSEWMEFLHKIAPSPQEKKEWRIITHDEQMVQNDFEDKQMWFEEWRKNI